MRAGHIVTYTVSSLTLILGRVGCGLFLMGCLDQVLG